MRIVSMRRLAIRINATRRYDLRCSAVRYLHEDCSSDGLELVFCVGWITDSQERLSSRRGHSHQWNVLSTRIETLTLGACQCYCGYTKTRQSYVSKPVGRLVLYAHEHEKRRLGESTYIQIHRRLRTGGH